MNKLDDCPSDCTWTERFILAGNATFTIVSKKTGVRFTYRVNKPKSNDPHFVSVLTSPDEYTFLGTIFEGRKFVYGRRSRINIDAPSNQAFAWFWNDVETSKVEFYHAGKCGRCGRELTVPSSIESGLGPECSKYGGPADPGATYGQGGHSQRDDYNYDDVDNWFEG